MNEDGLGAIQLRRQVARYLHAGVSLLNRRLVPLTHLALLFQALKRPTPRNHGLNLTGWPREALPFYLGCRRDKFKSYFLI